MTYRDRIAFEHPENLIKTSMGGVFGCPSDYGYELQSYCYGNPNYLKCAECWDREAPPRKVKVRRKNADLA